MLRTPRRERLRIARWQGRAEVNAAEEMARLTLEVVTRTLFGVDLSGEAARLGAAMAVIQETVIREMRAVDYAK